MKRMNEGEVSKSTIKRGDYFSCYCSYEDSRGFASLICGDLEHEVWYTERNGDPITLVAPKGTQESELPRMCKGYIIFKWERPEDGVL
jgi:hypothetical protein